MIRTRVRSRGGAGIVEFTPDPLLPNYTTAMTEQNNNTKSPIILAIGDSTTFGSFSAGASNAAGVDCNSGSYPAHLRTYFANGGRTAQQNSLIANGIAATTEVNSANDPRQTVLGAQWSRTNTTSKAVGGYSLLHTSTTHTPNTYQFSGIDYFRVWYAVDTGYGNLLYSVDGGSVTTISCAGTQAATHVDIPAGSVGTHSLTLNTDIAGNVIILGVEGYNSTASELKIRKAGWAGSRTTAWIETTNAWSPMRNVAEFTPDLILVCLGINHWIQSEATAPVATFQTDMTNLVTYYKGISDVAIVTPTASQDGANTFGTIARQQLFVDAMKTVGSNLSVKVIDWWTGCGGYDALNAAGAMTNATHPSSLGYQMKAAYIYNAIKVPTTYGV